MIRWNGHATQEGTLDFSKGETQGFTAAEGHFRKHSVLVSKDGLTTDLTLSSIGIGTYLGDADDATDELVENAIVRSVADGCNVIDTAAVYRMGRGEKSVGRALRALRLTGGAYRDHLFISTKAGYAPTPAMVEELQACGLITADDIKPMGTGGVIGCLHPAFIEHSLENSLAALQLGTVDILYLHNPAESFLEMLGLEKFMQRLEAAFQACERAREDGKIMAYGLATWECFRAHPDKEGVHLSLEAVVKLAEKVGGPNHGCRYIQLPVNAAMREAWEEKWQTLEIDGELRKVTVLDVAQAYGLGVFSSGPLGEAGILRDEPFMERLAMVPELAEVTGKGAKLLQIARSTPRLLTALVGHKTPMYVEENLLLTRVPPMDEGRFASVMTQLK